MSYKGREGSIEPATVAKVVALFKKGFVDGLAPGLNSIRPGSISEAAIGLIKQANTTLLSCVPGLQRTTFIGGPKATGSHPLRVGLHYSRIFSMLACVRTPYFMGRLLKYCKKAQDYHYLRGEICTSCGELR